MINRQIDRQVDKSNSDNLNAKRVNSRLLELRQNFWYFFSHCPQAGLVEQDCNPFLSLITGWSCGLCVATPSLQLRLPPSRPEAWQAFSSHQCVLPIHIVYQCAKLLPIYALVQGEAQSAAPWHRSLLYILLKVLPWGTYMFPVLHIFCDYFINDVLVPPKSSETYRLKSVVLSESFQWLRKDNNTLL